MVKEKPEAALTLSSIGLALQAIGAISSAYGAFYGWDGGSSRPSSMMGPWMMVGGPWSAGFLWSPFSAVFTGIVVGLGILGVLWINTSDVGRVRAGSTLMVVASVIAFPTMFGFILGSLLMFIGGILGLTWQPLIKKVS